MHYVFCLLALLPTVLATLRRCKTFPGDRDWPSPGVWDAFNASVDGRLIRTVPIGTPCHHGTSFSEDECSIIQSNWHNSSFHELSSSSTQVSLWANQSCDPFSGPDSQCVIGTYVQYAVNVSTPAHVISTLKFAKKHNIRFVVRNTGHDYFGRSTGAGGLSIWTFHLKETQWIDRFVSSTYKGVAVKAQAGVSGLQIYQEANARGKIVVAGACPTVGWAGGYIQGGGHSPMGSKFGMGADQLLSMEVITTTGKLVTASPTQNQDLFWAMSGGGGGTYGILWSLTVKAFPDMPCAGALLSFNTGPTVSLAKWWEAVDFYQENTPKTTDAGGVSYSFYSEGSFQMAPLFLPNSTAADVKEHIQPLVNKLESLGIPHNLTIAEFPGFFAAHEGLFPPESFAVGVMQFGGRLLPRSLWESKASLAKLKSVVRTMVEDDAVIFDIAVSPTKERGGNPKNAVLPAWRDAERTFYPTLPWMDRAPLSVAVQQENKITHAYDAALRALAPKSGAYLNEGDPFEPDFKTAFYGVNYPRLLEIKDKWDPDQLLFGAIAVGGDRWKTARDGRLCPA
ncbi:oxygen-dependent FAD-linked oxidoreductase family protein [Pleurotus pulmonarius]